MSDPTGQIYQIEFDPPSNPDMATGAEIIGTAFYHAIGYHVVEVYLAEFDPATMVIAPTARVFDPLLGERRPLTRADVETVLARAAPQPDGTYRVLASRFAPGRPLGNFRYYGVRPDDPNDVFAHEHRRELRAARVFGAWLNHDDSRGVNSLDMLHSENGRTYVKHYMFDFGSIMGSGTGFSQTRRGGHEYIFEAAAECSVGMTRARTPQARPVRTQGRDGIRTRLRTRCAGAGRRGCRAPCPHA
jgi:hypothetical protein